ncbi:hypothetical protein Agub_g12049 [Astrephomene gubernaculifera]|uniref:Uncharacterized protein n=1 Tax=Astrephomene gubernaculifera TaxID=47775 RepID=A0AAD3HRA0_9CHLO|nr:hypothetical protein Agub_g12049 [Astrephomene gubernaculifera]
MGQSRPLPDRAVHPFLLKLFCSTPFTACSAYTPSSSSPGPTLPCDSSPISSPARTPRQALRPSSPGPATFRGRRPSLLTDERHLPNHDTSWDDPCSPADRIPSRTDAPSSRMPHHLAPHSKPMSPVNISSSISGVRRCTSDGVPSPPASPHQTQRFALRTPTPRLNTPAGPSPGLARPESPARHSTLRTSMTGGMPSTPSSHVRRSDNGVFSTVHAVAAFSMAGRTGSATTTSSTPRRSECGILARKGLDGGAPVERSGSSTSGGGKERRGAPQLMLGDRSVADVVANFIKPETAGFKYNYLTGLLNGQCKVDGVEGECFSADLHERDGNTEYWRRATGEKIHGPVDYFVSHCWQYKLGDLVAMILQHYDELPETDGGRLYVPVFYWVDIFAVTQHFSGDFKDHPDADFPGVIRAAKGGVLFSMAPWRNPLSVRRVWCLFEALTALSINREINLLTDAFDSTAKVDTLLPLFTRQVVDMLDVRNAEATVEKDRDYILNLAARTLGIDTFNSKLRQALHHEICEAMILRAVMTGETDEGRKLLERGIVISNATLRFMPRRDSGGKETERIRDSGLALLAEAVKACPNLQSLVVYTAAETDVTPAGLITLAKGLAGHPALRHLVVGRYPQLAGVPGTGGSLGRSSVTAYAALLNSNPNLTHLDLSYNKLGPEGVAALAPALSGNRTISVLKLRQVGMDGASSVTLADACMTAEGLRDLDLSLNPDMGDKAAPALLRLMSHKGLKVLRAHCCRLGWQTGRSLISDALIRAGCVKELCLGCVVQPGGSVSNQDPADWNHLLLDTSGPSPAKGYRVAAHGDALVGLALALRQGFRTLERLDLRGCFIGNGMAGEAAGLRDALISGLSSVRRGAAFGSLRHLDLRSCNQSELTRMEDSQIALLLKHGGLNLLVKDYKRTGIKGGALRQYVQYDA